MQTTQDFRIQQLDIKYFAIYAEHGTRVDISQKNVGMKKNNNQDTDD